MNPEPGEGDETKKEKTRREEPTFPPQRSKGLMVAFLGLTVESSTIRHPKILAEVATLII